MGNCAAKRVNRSYPSSIKVSVPDLCYLNRKSLSLLTVISQEIKHFNLKRKIKLYADSAISWLSDGTLMIGGGSDSSSCLTRRVFLISPQSSSVHELSQLPVPVKLGHFVKHIKHTYYVGGITQAEDSYSEAVEEGAPLLRYNTEENSWEMFRNQDPGNDLNKILQRNICHEEDKERQSVYTARPESVSLKDLVNFGVFVYGDRIYLVGGKVYRDGRYQIISTVISFSANLEIFEFREEISLELPVKVHGAACSIRRNLACVVGGYLENELPNMEIFILDLADSTVKVLSAEIERPLEDHYPVFLEQKGILCFSPPKLLYVRQDKKNTFTFMIPTLTSTVSEINVINQVKEQPHKTYFLNFSLNLSFTKQQTGTGLDGNDSPRIPSIRISNLEAGIPPLTSISSINSPRSKHEQNDTIFENILVGDEEKMEKIAEGLKIDQEGGIFCESNHRLVWSRLNTDQKITPKPLTQCSYCKKLLEDSCWECKICNFLLCSSCGEWVSNAKVVDSRVLRCYSNHFFYGCRNNVEEEEELIFHCCACNKNTTGAKIECRKCNTLLCRSCEISISEYSLRRHKPKCMSGHRLHWVLMNSLESPQSFQCFTCKREYNAIGCFHCSPCSLNLCINCLQPEYQSPKKVNNDPNADQFKGKMSRTPNKELGDLCENDLRESPSTRGAKSHRGYVKDAQDRESTNNEARRKPPVVVNGSEISSVRSSKSSRLGSPHHNADDLMVQEIISKSRDRVNKLESENIENIPEANFAEEDGLNIDKEINLDFEVQIEDKGRDGTEIIGNLEDNKEVEESLQPKKHKKRSKRHKLKLSLQEDPLIPEECEVFVESKNAENGLLVNNVSPKGSHTSRVHREKNLIGSDHSDENLDYKNQEIHVNTNKKRHAHRLRVEESAIEENITEKQIIEEQGIEDQIVEGQIVEEPVVEEQVVEEQMVEGPSMQRSRNKKDKNKRKKKHRKELEDFHDNLLSPNGKHEETDQEVIKISDVSIISDDPGSLIAPVIEESYASEMIKALANKMKWFKSSNRESPSNVEAEEEKTDVVQNLKNKQQVSNYPPYLQEISSRNDSSQSEYALDLPELS